VESEVTVEVPVLSSCHGSRQRGDHLVRITPRCSEGDFLEDSA